MEKRRAVNRTTLTRMGLLVIVVSIFIACPSWGAEWPKQVTVISPAPGASVHMVQVGVGQVVQKYTPIEDWIVQPLGGPKLWLPLMAQGKADFANHNAADIINAFLGRGLYTKMAPQNVRTVAAGHDYMFMFWTIESTGVRFISDLKGKVVYNKFKANLMNKEIDLESLYFYRKTLEHERKPGRKYREPIYGLLQSAKNKI